MEVWWCQCKVQWHKSQETHTSAPSKLRPHCSICTIMRTLTANKSASAQLLKRFFQLSQNSVYIIYLRPVCFPLGNLPGQPHHLTCFYIIVAWHLCHHLHAASQLFNFMRILLACHLSHNKSHQICVQSKSDIPPCSSCCNDQCTRS